MSFIFRLYFTPISVIFHLELTNISFIFHVCFVNISFKLHLHYFVGKNNDELLDGANKIQDLTLDSLVRSRAMIEASKEVGAATIEGNY